MFILFSIWSGLEFWSVNNASINKNSESKGFKNLKYLDEKSNNWPNDLLGTRCICEMCTRLLNLADIIVVNSIKMY